MAKKNTEPIKTLGRDTSKLTVQKSKPLFALWTSDLTLAEFKILDTYLGRINSHDDEHRTVKFKKGELESLLGVKQLKPQVLDDRLKHLMTTVRIPDSDCERGFTRIALFEKAHAEQDNYGVWEAELTCTDSAKKYIFDVESLNYLRYKLKNIINIKSRYTYIIFLYLWENKYRGIWEESLDKLKLVLNCDNEPSYDKFKVFNDRILKRVHQEIHKVTDIQYDYETVKKGRSVVAIRFIYKPKLVDSELVKNQILPEKNTSQMIFENSDQKEEIDYGGELADLLGSAACEDEFSPEQVRVLQDLVLQVMRPISADYMEMVDYLVAKIHIMNIYDNRNKIKDRFAYLCTMIKKDI